MRSVAKAAVTVVLAVSIFGGQASAYEGDAARDILKQGLLGAATGALSAGASGGKAGKGALIGAGTNVIGGALLGFLTGSPAPRQTALETGYAPQPVVYERPRRVVRAAPVYVQTAPVYAEPGPVYYSAPAPAYAEAPRTDGNTQILRQGLLGAGVGAISAGASGGKAGTGALVGAGTQVIGGALLDTLFSAPSRPASYAYGPSGYSYPAIPAGHRLVRTYDSAGNLIAEQVV